MIRRSLQIALLLICVGAGLVPSAAGGEAARFAQAGPPAQGGATPPAATEKPAPDVAPAPEQDTAEPPLPKVTPPTLEELLEPIGAITVAIEAAEQQLEQPPEGQNELATLRSDIEKIGFRAKAAADALRPRLEEVRSQIAKLGDAPAADAPPEAPEVAAERDRLNTLAAQIDGAIKKADLIEVRAQQLVSRVQHVRQGIFTRFLLRQSDSPLQPSVWQTTAEQLGVAPRQILFILTNWWSVASSNIPGAIAVLAAALIVYLFLRLLTGGLIRSRLNGAPTQTPPVHERAASAVWVTAAFALPAGLAAIVLYVGLDEMQLLYWQAERFAQALLSSFLVFVAISALARAALQPTRPRWRLFDLADSSAATICRAVQAIAGIYALDFLARRMISILALPGDVGIAAASLASLLIAILLLVILRTPFAPRTLAPGIVVSRWRPFWLKLLLLALALAVLGSALLGYISLGRFLAGQLLMTGSGLVLVALLHIAIKGLRAGPADAAHPLNALLEQNLKLDETGRRRMLRVARLVLNLVLVGVAAPIILVGWGVTSAEILSWLRTAVLGFEVGGVHISLARILVALVLFAVLLGATRLFQRWIAARALPDSRFDPGVVNSIYTGAGYLGFAVALLVAVAYAGFDITSLAIVAGALSVGIGFGLQSIVNNFVSGLVLLVERPIKVGDWIVTRDGEGYVRHISVRATEIETFDRASLIVPNSELITHTVTNLTHRNQLGRLNISVRVSYASDPELAQRVLQEAAEANTSILRHPPPLVVLDNLGDQAMEYSVRVYLADVNHSLQVQTEMRTQIVKGLRAAGVDIPYFAVQVGHASGPRSVPGRVAVKIGTALSSDPDAVLAALEAAAQACPGALNEPAPEVTFDSVGDNALEFSVSVAVAEDAQGRQVETRLRAAAVKTLRARGIDIANTRHALHQRDLDGLRTALSRLAQEQHRTPSDSDLAASQSGNPKPG